MRRWHTHISICFVALLAAVMSVAPVRAESVPLVEIIYELDLRSLDGRSLPSSQSDAELDPHGYVLADRGSGESSVLYPAMGKPLPDTSQTGLWAALRFRDHLAGVGADAKTLEPVAALPYSPDLQSASAITPSFDIAVAELDGGIITIVVDGVAQTLVPGTPTAVAVGDRTVSLDAIVDAVLESYTAAAVPQADMPSREAVVKAVTVFSSGDGSVTFHARVVAVNHGPVALADVDLATTLDDARRLSREGPYEEALTALETLRDATPQHAEAARLFHRVRDWVEAGATPGHAVGQLQFAAGQPDAAIQALWAEVHAGIAMFARPDDPVEAVMLAVPIADGAFEAYLPAGEYRLMVNVPGFAPAELSVTIDGEAVIDVPVRSAP